MAKTKLVALKSFTYWRLRVRKGEVFEAKDQDAKAFVAVKLARLCDDGDTNAVVSSHYRKSAPAVMPTDAPVSVPILKQKALSEIETARAKYQYLSGRAPDMRWGLPRLQAEIDALENSEERG